jgi:hypothetical protein
MGFNKKYVRPLETLKEELKNNPDSINYYMKADAFIGSKESIDYLDEFWEEYKKNKDILKNSSPME